MQPFNATIENVSHVVDPAELAFAATPSTTGEVYRPADGSFAIENELAAMQARRLDVETALDVGTGSGFLAIVIARLWPEARIQAIDHQPLCTAVARLNVEKLGLAKRIYVHRRPAAEIEGVFDLVVANLEAFVHHEAAEMIIAATGKRLVIAGPRGEDFDFVVRRYGKAFCVQVPSKRAGWPACLFLR